jgi:hypothetical protein
MRGLSDGRLAERAAQRRSNSKKARFACGFERLDLPRKEALNFATVPKRNTVAGQKGALAHRPRRGRAIFPTEGASNPTYTILALSLRGAEHLADRWSAVAG